jgi:ATP-dependent DNA ligase
LPLAERKTRLAALLGSPPPGIDFSPHEAGDGEAFRRAACGYGLEGVISKRLDRRYLPDDRKVWIKTKCLNRGEFVVAGWADPEGSRPYLGSLLLAYHDDNGRLLYAGRVGTGMSQKTLAALHERLAPLAVKTSPPRRPAPARDALRRSPRALARPLGPTRSRRRNHLSHLGRRRIAPPHRLCRPPRR